MIVTKDSPYTKDEIENLKETFEVYIKTVIDINKKFVQQDVIGTMNQTKYY